MNKKLYHLLLAFLGMSMTACSVSQKSYTKMEAALVESKKEKRVLKDSIKGLVVQLEQHKIPVRGHADSTIVSNTSSSNEAVSFNPLPLRSLVDGMLHTKQSTFSFSAELYENRFDFFVVDVQKEKLQFYWQDSAYGLYRSLDRLKQAIEKKQHRLIFATNGGMYKPDNSPQGLYVENGKLINSIDKKKKAYGNFYLQPNGIFFIDTSGHAGILTSTTFDSLQIQATFATQSGPMLVIDGERHAAFTKGSKNKYIRSGVGVLSSTKVIFVISQKPVNFYDFSSLFKNLLNCKNALYLDGAISRMYIEPLGRNQLGGNFGPIIGVVR